MGIGGFYTYTFEMSEEKILSSLGLSRLQREHQVAILAVLQTPGSEVLKTMIGVEAYSRALQLAEGEYNFKGEATSEMSDLPLYAFLDFKVLRLFCDALVASSGSRVTGRRRGARE